jgi:lipoprotein NlpD
MVRVYILTIIVLALIISGCAPFTNYGDGYSRKSANSKTEYDRNQKPSANTSVKTHTVRKGDTIYSIAWQYGYDVRKIASWNKIRRPYTIYPGQHLVVRPIKSYSTFEKPVTKKSSQNKQSRTPKTKQKVESRYSNNKNIRWAWPTKGKVVSRYVTGDPGRQGIDIAGRKGQTIKAAAQGKVVYSGSGLRGYGKLVIIKHNETYFSAYAHNNKIHVKEGEIVKSGQQIADMGNSGAEKIMLHFEIRRNGKPSNPLKYLPK